MSANRALRDALGGSGPVRLPTKRRIRRSQPADPPCTITSFDVFDTLLTRAVGTPQAVFLLLGRQLHEQAVVASTPEYFARSRMAAEQRAFRNAGGHDSHVTLVDIYAELAPALSLGDAARDLAMRLELDLESRLSRVLVPGAERVRVARRSRERIVFVSDMYLRAEFLERLLRRHRIAANGDAVYVSSEFGKTKASGALFRHVADAERVDLASVLHVGNDQRRDIRPAQTVGCRAVHLRDGNLNRYERALDGHKWATDGLSSVLAGASRLARASVPARDQREAALRDVAAGVAAPLLVGYVLWLLNRARRSGVQKLFFLSRDGQVLLRIARRLAGVLESPVELDYLHGSRKVWNLAASAIAESGSEQDAWVWTHARGSSAVAMLDRVSIRPEEIQEELERHGLTQRCWDRPLRDDERARLLHVLDEEPVRSLVQRRAVRARTLAMAYLEQQGFLTSAETAVVDLGGVGSQLRALGAMRRGRGLPALTSYLAYRERHFSATHGRRQAWTGEPPQTYLFDQDRQLGVRRFPGMVPFLEVFCAADHNTVVAYDEVGDTTVPVLGPGTPDALTEWGLPLVRRTMDAFVDALVLDADLVDTGSDVREATVDAFESFVCRPTPAEAAAWGGFPFEAADRRGSGRVTLATPYTFRDVTRLLSPASSGHWFAWRGGSIALSGPVMRHGIRVAQAASSARQRGMRRLAGGSPYRRRAPVPVASGRTRAR